MDGPKGFDFSKNATASGTTLLRKSAATTYCTRTLNTPNAALAISLIHAYTSASLESCSIRLQIATTSSTTTNSNFAATNRLYLTGKACCAATQCGYTTRKCTHAICSARVFNPYDEQTWRQSNVSTVSSDTHTRRDRHILD